MSSSRSLLPAQALRLALRQWGEALEGLRITAAEDQPMPGTCALADRLADDTDEVMGWLSEAAASVQKGDCPSEIHRLVGRALRTQGEALFGCVRHAHLEQLARGADLGWRAWVCAVRSALEPLWARSEEVVTRLAIFPSPATESASRAPRCNAIFQEKTTLNHSN